MTVRQQFIETIERKIRYISLTKWAFDERMEMTRSDVYAYFNKFKLNEISECDEVRNNEELWNWYLNASDNQWKNAVHEARRQAYRTL